MRYPVLTVTKCSELASQLAAGGDPAVEPHVRWIGFGDDVDLAPIERVAKEIIATARNWADPDRDLLEGRECARLFTALEHVRSEVLDDRGFWRYLSLRFFWEFIAWREEGPFAKGNHLKYVDAASSSESVLPRMYLRARAVGGDEHADLAAAIPRGGDFWRSHVIRVRTGSAAPVTRALATKQRDERLMTTPLRQAAKRLNRTWANIVLYLHDDEAAARLIDSIWDAGE